MGIERIRNEALRAKVTTAEQAARIFRDGDVVGSSGFTVVGYPKVIPAAMAKRAAEGDPFGITLIVGGNVGDELDGVLTRAGILKRRYGYQATGELRDLINQDKVKYVDMHVSHVPTYIKNGYFGEIDVAILEVSGIDEQGNLIPTCAVGIMDTLARYAKSVVLEVNSMIPAGLAGMHDIFTAERPPHTQTLSITKPSDRIGMPFIKCDPEKIKAIVLTELEDTNKNLMDPNGEMNAIASHLVQFFKEEMAKGRLSDPLPPFQSGVGGVANAVLHALASSDLQNLSVYTEVMQDAVINLLDAGKVSVASGTALTISPALRERFYQNIDDYRSKIILRPQEVSNSPEVIQRLGVIAMNTAIEVDLSGNVNSTHIGAERVMNGIGGSADYTRNSGLSVFTTASTAKNGTLSCIVPHVGHIDHTEHDTQIIVTEQGLADLRGLTAYERAELLIERCAHPKFREELRAYRDKAYQTAKDKHAITRL